MHVHIYHRHTQWYVRFGQSLSLIVEDFFQKFYEYMTHEKKSNFRVKTNQGRDKMAYINLTRWGFSVLATQFNQCSPTMF